MHVSRGSSRIRSIVQNGAAGAVVLGSLASCGGGLTTKTPNSEPSRPAPSIAGPTPSAEGPERPAPPAADPPITAHSSRGAAVRTVSAFPPPEVQPPSQRSASPGDGKFVPLGDEALGERAATRPPLVVKTVLHPHPGSRFITVTVAAIDLGRAAVRLVAGTDDLAWAKLPVDDASGTVPPADRDALLLVMNGGFQPKHGHRGLVANRVLVSKPRGDGCTVLLDDAGGVRIAPYPELPDADAARSLRETPPCLLQHGEVHPSLLAGKDSQWAGHASDLKTRRRSAIGLDGTGTVLFYAVGEETEPRWLAEGLRLAGAAVAAELDINWYWTRFLLVGKVGETLGPTTSLIPKMEHLSTEYVERPSIRDFFYVTKKTP